MNKSKEEILKMVEKEYFLLFDFLAENAPHTCSTHIKDVLIDWCEQWLGSQFIYETSTVIVFKDAAVFRETIYEHSDKSFIEKAPSRVCGNYILDTNYKIEYLDGESVETTIYAANVPADEIFNGSMVFYILDCEVN